MEIKIEKGVPIPASPRRKGKAKYPMNQLEVGDSFIYSSIATRSTRVSANSLCAIYKHRGKRFEWREMDGLIRIWRVL